MQRWRSAGAVEDGAGANAGSKLKFNSSGARNLSEGAATRHRAGIADYNCGEGRPIRAQYDMVFRRLTNVVLVVEAEMWRLDTQQLSTEMKVTQYGGRHCHSTIDVGLSPFCSIVTVVTLYRVSSKFYLILSAISSRFSFSIDAETYLNSFLMSQL